MSKKPSIFSFEEKTKEHAQSVLNDINFKDNALMPEFAELFKRYSKMLNQLIRLVKISDSQQQLLNSVNKKLDTANTLIRSTFGRYLSDEVVDTILESPEGMQLGGEKRTVTIMMTDLRGLTAISERLPAENVVKLINTYLEVMTEILMRYHGTIDEFIGDAILAIFGAPVHREDDADRAIACAIEMQLAMQEVNRRNKANGYPNVEMGIGLNTGGVIVGNIGSSKRTKYGVVGRNVNLASRIESYTVGGQIFISESTRLACGAALRIDDVIEIMPKGVKEPLHIYDIGGIGGNYHKYLPEKQCINLNELTEEISINIRELEGKDTGLINCTGKIIKLGSKTAEIHADKIISKLANIRISVFDRNGIELTSELYAKITDQVCESSAVFLVTFTSTPPEAKNYFDTISVK